MQYALPRRVGEWTAYRELILYCGFSLNAVLFYATTLVSPKSCISQAKTALLDRVTRRDFTLKFK